MRKLKKIKLILIYNFESLIFYNLLFTKETKETFLDSDFKNFLAVIPETYAKNLDGVETTGDFRVSGKIKHHLGLSQESREILLKLVNSRKKSGKRDLFNDHALIGVVAALIAAMSYGVSDFVGGIASRRVAALRVVIISYPVALVVLVL